MASRRTFLQTGLAALSVGALAPLLSPNKVSAAARPSMANLKGPILNHDSTAFFTAYSSDKMSGTLVDDWVDSLDAAGVGVMVSNINAMRANYASKVWEPDWQGYDPKGPDDQPVLKHLARETIPLTRKRL